MQRYFAEGTTTREDQLRTAPLEESSRSRNRGLDRLYRKDNRYKKERVSGACTS